MTESSRDYFGKRIDAIIDASVKFFFEVFPYITLTIAFVYFLYKLLGPIVIIKFS